MFNFFVEDSARNGDRYIISGADFNHIKNVLRMKIGEKLLVSDGGTSHLCVIEDYSEENVTVSVLEANYNDTELPTRIYLFQGLPKGDKLELIIQKAVELGVYEIIPVEMSRSVVKIEDKKRKSKQERWQAIAESAAKQSKRNIIPNVREATSFKQAMEVAKGLDVFAVPYENKDGMKATAECLDKIKGAKSVGILIGPEGGFAEHEIEMAMEANGAVISLGKRILRAETAAITAVSAVMLYIEMSCMEETV